MKAQSYLRDYISNQLPDNLDGAPLATHMGTCSIRLSHFVPIQDCQNRAVKYLCKNDF